MRVAPGPRMPAVLFFFFIVVVIIITLVVLLVPLPPGLIRLRPFVGVALPTTLPFQFRT
jgi:hypothetical protein